MMSCKYQMKDEKKDVLNVWVGMAGTLVPAVFLAGHSPSYIAA